MGSSCGRRGRGGSFVGREKPAPSFPFIVSHGTAQPVAASVKALHRCRRVTWLFPLSHWRLSFNLSRIWSGDSLTHSEVFDIRMTAPVPGPHSCERSRIISTRVDSTHTGVPSSWVSITMLISADLAAARTAHTCAATVSRHCFRRFFGFAMACKQVRERFISSTQCRPAAGSLQKVSAYRVRSSPISLRPSAPHRISECQPSA